MLCNVISRRFVSHVLHILTKKPDYSLAMALSTVKVSFYKKKKWLADIFFGLLCMKTNVYDDFNCLN